MRRKISLIIASVLMAGTLSGCVKIIDKGTEGNYTGVMAFDAAADSSSDWDQIAGEITGSAAELTDVLAGDGIGSNETAAVKGTGTVKEFVTKGPKNLLLLELDGYSGEDTFTLQIGSVYSGTAIRDIQTLKNFESFTNQTEWSQYAKALNAEMHAQVVEPLGLDESVTGKKVTFVGGATASGTEVTITPVSLTVE